MGSSVSAKGGITWSAMPNGNVQLRISDEERKFIEIEVPPLMMSVVVAEALLATGAASEVPNPAGGDEDMQIDELPAVPLSKLALAPSPIDGHKTLVLEVGAAQLGFMVPDTALAGLGKLLLQAESDADPSG